MEFKQLFLAAKSGKINKMTGWIKLKYIVRQIKITE